MINLTISGGRAYTLPESVIIEHAPCDPALLINT
jgi:hypothetical protein